MKKIILNKKKHKRNAFTLIEMLIVLVVVALLMAIIIPNVSGQRDRIEEQGRDNITEIVSTQLNTYGIVEGSTSGVTTQMLADSGYLTPKQVEEANRLINLSPDQPIESVLP